MLFDDSFYSVEVTIYILLPSLISGITLNLFAFLLVILLANGVAKLQPQSSPILQPTIRPRKLPPLFRHLFE